MSDYQTLLWEPHGAVLRLTCHRPQVLNAQSRVMEDAMRSAGVAMCTIDQEEFASPMIPTTPWGYLRLHRFDYDDRALETWARRILDEPWEEAYVYFKHDDTPFTGPPAVRAFLAALVR